MSEDELRAALREALDALDRARDYDFDNAREISDRLRERFDLERSYPVD